MDGIVRAWGRILQGYRPALSIEITRECPLRCPGCYAYGDEHLGGDVTLRGLADYKGDELVSRFMALIDHHRPLHDPRLPTSAPTSIPRATRSPAVAGTPASRCGGMAIWRSSSPSGRRIRI